MMSAMSGRPFLQTPGPTNIPDRVLRAIDAHDVGTHRREPRRREVYPMVPSLASSRCEVRPRVTGSLGVMLAMFQ